MKMLKFWVAAVGFSAVLSLAGTAQETGPLLVTPNTASVSAGESERLVPGQSYIFQLRFDPAPDGYGGGQINYLFREVAPDLPPDFYSQPRFYEIEAGGQTELHDGQAIYTLSLPITDSMSGGTWKLVSVTLGRKVQKLVPIRENITFEIPQKPATVVRIQAPASVRAGQRLTFEVTLDQYPKDLTQSCVVLSLSGNLQQAGLNGNPAPGGFRIPVEPVEIKPYKLSNEVSVSFDPDLPPGPWRGEISISSHGAPPRGYRMPCRPPRLKGDLWFAFTVEPAMGLITPTSVAVTVNPSQIQLLLAEADRLKAKAEHLKQQLNSESVAGNRFLLKNSVQEAITDLDKTEETYKQEGLDPSSARAVNIFFDDIRLNYGEALKALANNSAQVAQTAARLERVGAVLGGPSPRLSHASQAVLASILHNSKAYSVVASSGFMTFNLEVDSDPQGASVSYRQRGGEYHPLDHETDWRIENLPRAVYLIRLQKSGYEDKEVTFDAMDSTSSSVHVRLERKRGAR